MKETVTGEPARFSLPPAPGADRYLALDFANTVLALSGGQFLDLLGSPEAAAQWLAERELVSADARLQEVCAARLRGLRDQVRALLASRIGALPAPSEALRVVNDALTSATAASLLHWDEAHGLHRARSHTTQTVDHALAVLAADAADLLTGPDAERLAPCGAATCTRYLLRTHARRHWCSVRCGDRVRAARAYARRTQPKAD
jgi:predicted RNA-binding Zn ribbon-like protein